MLIFLNADRTDFVNLTWSAHALFNSSLKTHTNYDIKIQKLSVIPPKSSLSASMLQLKLQFKRRIGVYIITTYFPSSLIVIVSFISFWIDPLSVPGRVTLTITSLLALVTQFISVRDQLSDVNHVTAMDVWFMGCILFVCFNLFMFALNHFLARKREILSEGVRRQNSANYPKIKWGINYKRFAFHSMKNCMKGKLKEINYDTLSRIIFPFSFLLYCISYWAILLYVPRDIFND